MKNKKPPTSNGLKADQLIMCTIDHGGDGDDDIDRSFGVGKTIPEAMKKAGVNLRDIERCQFFAVTPLDVSIHFSAKEKKR